jgi:AcrR family transcriptional regulator
VVLKATRSRRRPEPAPARPAEDLSVRAKRTRAALVEGARRVFERDGFLEARVTDIAENAKVAHGTFYRYFNSKEEIFREVVVQVHAELWHPFDQISENPFQMIEEIVRYYLEVYRRNARLLVEWERAAAVNSEFQRVQRDLRQAYADWTEVGIRRLQRQGRADVDLDPPFTAFVATGMVNEFAHRWFADRRDFDFDFAVEQLSRICANSLGLPPRDSLRSSTNGSQ